MNETKKKFKTRTFATFMISWIFIILAFSGIIIFFTPAGRIANWTSWTFMGLNKDEWQGFHIVFACLFLMFIILHLYFNWKVLMSYFKNKVSQGFYFGRELAYATMIMAVFFLFTLVKWQPVWDIVELRGSIKDRGQAVKTAPPLPHTEDMTITDIAALINIPVEKILKNVKEKGFSIIDSGITLGSLAEQNSTTPEKLYSDIVDKENQQPVLDYGGGGSGLGRKSTKERTEILKKEQNPDNSGIRRWTGYGRKTISQLCREAGITTEQGIKNLKIHGIKARTKDRVKDLAVNNNVRPSDIARYLKGN